MILDYPGWGRRKRGLVGLTSVSVPLVIAWIWEMVCYSDVQVDHQILIYAQIRTRNYDRNNPPTKPTDWDDARFGWVFVLFMLNWIFSVWRPLLLLAV